MTSLLFRRSHVFGRLARFASSGSAQPLSYDEVTKIHKDNLSPSLVPFYRKPVLITKGEMQYLWDSEGKKYLDLFAGIVTVSCGHCHPKVTQAAINQLQKLWHTTHIYMTPPMHEYAKKLTAKMPGNLKVCYFVNSGSEANDMALTLARLYTGNHDIVALRNAYHGMSNLAMGITNLGIWRHKIVTTNLHQAMNPDPYRGIWGGSNCRDSHAQTTRSCSCQPGHCEASDKYFEQLQDVFDSSIPKTGAAAFIAESIQGVGGTVQFPNGYLKRAAELVRSRGGLFIADEVQTGFGRTGDHYWGFEGHDLVPDIVTMAKGMGNGFPMGAVVTTPEIAKSLSGALHFNTFGGNPVASAVGSAVLDAIEEDKLQENCQNLGPYFLKKLAEIRDRSDVVGDVRGKGLMLGLELVENKETRKPLSLSRVDDIFEEIKDKGVLIGRSGAYKHIFRIKPPMCINKDDVDHALNVLDDVFSKAKP